jgi:hypothetical protein
MVRAANERSTLFYVGGMAWVICSILLTVWGFGVVAFCGSILLAIWWFGFREKFSNEETASAYSVFNKDGQAIVGGFTASQFDRQLRGGFAPRDDADNPVKGSIATAAEVSTTAAAVKTTDANERLRRRTAAAVAAEKRFQTTQTAS